MESTGGSLTSPLYGRRDICHRHRTSRSWRATEEEQFEVIPLPEQLMHLKSEDPFDRRSHGRTPLGIIVTAYGVSSPKLNFSGVVPQVSFPQKFEYTPRDNRLLINEPRDRGRFYASDVDEIVGIFKIWGWENEWQVPDTVSRTSILNSPGL